MYVDRQPIIDLVEQLRPTMSLAKAIDEALRQYPGPSPMTVRRWLPKPATKPRPTEEHFNISKQAAVDRVWALVEGGMSRLAACREVFPTVSDIAWGYKGRSIARLYRWCDGPQGDRYHRVKIDYLTPDQQCEFHTLVDMGHKPSVAYKEVRAAGGSQPNG